MLQVEQAARVAAQRMLEELQQQYNAAVDEAVAERLHRERLAEQLSELQVLLLLLLQALPGRCVFAVHVSARDLQHGYHGPRLHNRERS
jgi:hypothetical protein